MMRFPVILGLLPIGLAAGIRRAERAPLLTPRDADQLIPDKYIVKFTDDILISSLDVEIVSFADAADYTYNGSFAGFAGHLDPEDLETLRLHPKVEYIEQDAIFKAAAYVQQPGSPWGLARISSRTKGATKYVYDSSAGQGTCSYIIDTGIDPTHPDFGGRAIQAATFVNGNNIDGNGHGTHIAGIIGGTTYGVAKRTTLLGIKVLDDNGSGTTSAVIAGMNFVPEDAATRSCPKGVFVNMSIGGAFSTSVNRAAAALVSWGSFVAAASGNQGSDAGNFSPASEPTVCTVGASDRNDNVAGISNWGSVIDVFAPGRDIPSTWIGGGVRTLSGTSMAASHVCGLAAYLATFEGRAANTLCGRIQQLATAGVLSGVPAGTVNLLAFNGNPSG